MDITYKPLTVAMMKIIQSDTDNADVVGTLVDAIDGVPLDEVDSKTRFKATFEVLSFLAEVDTPIAMNSAGDS